MQVKGNFCDAAALAFLFSFFLSVFLSFFFLHVFCQYSDLLGLF